VATATPTVTWTASPVGTATLTAYQVVTYLASTTTASGFVPGQPSGLLDNSGVVTGNGTSYQTGFLPNDSSVVSYVQVTQSGNETSGWSSTSYTTTFAIPSTPTLSTSGPSLDANGAPVVALKVVAPASSVTGTLTAVVYYTDANTPTPTPVRATAPVAATGSTVLIADYEVTFGVPRTYEAAVVSATNGPSAYSNSVTVTQNTRNWVLSNPLNPAQFLVLSRLGGQSSGTTSLQAQTSIEIDRSRNQTVFRPFGKQTATVQYGDVYQPTMTVNFLLNGYAAERMLDEMWATTDTLLLRSDMADAWYVDAGPTRPVVILSAGDRATNPFYTCTLTCTVTDRP
jgi:hypothetical protein